MGKKVKFYFFMNVKHMDMMKLIFEYHEGALVVSSNSQENMFFFSPKYVFLKQDFLSFLFNY